MNGWKEVAARRIENILRQYTVSRKRTLEQKICDAGPNNQRPNPHHLSNALSIMIGDGIVIRVDYTNGPWFYLAETPEYFTNEQLSKLKPIATRFQSASKRTGQCLEIAIYKALQAQDEMDYFGHFPDLSRPGNTGLYNKVEPPSHFSNRHLPQNKKLDFIITGPEKAGIEAKNIREWLYPDRDEIRDLLFKTTELDLVPVLIARRIPYVTFMLLKQCGCVFHQNYNQLMDKRDITIAEEAKDKNLLGYHDIRIGFEPDKRLIKFIGKNLPVVLPRARKKFDVHKDLLKAYATSKIDYRKLVKEIKIRKKI